MEPIPPTLMNQLLQDEKIRITVTTEQLNLFFPIYFYKHIKYPLAPMHHEILSILGDSKQPNFVLTGFRGCAKSTLITHVYSIWAIVGYQAKKHIVLVSQTQQRAKQNLKNIKAEFEDNELLRRDFGEFEEDGEEWASYSLILPKYDAKITAVSIQESIRGIKYKQYRPDLIIFDDIEDLNSVKTQEARDSTSDQIKGQFLPAGEKDTRIIFVGNMLHQDSVMMRFKKDIELGIFDGIYKEYPLFNSNQKCLWPGKYPTSEDIEKEKKKVSDEASWLREYMLTIIPDQGQIIRPEWIATYDPSMNTYQQLSYCYTLIAVDPAVSPDPRADCTAIIVGDVYKDSNKKKLIIKPHPINARMEFPETITKIKELYNYLKNNKRVVRDIFIEDNGSQKGFVQTLKRDGLPVVGIHSVGDKKARLRNAAFYIQEKHILFPSPGADLLLNQLFKLGTEKHDDLADACSMLINQFGDQKDSDMGVGTLSEDGEIRINGKTVSDLQRYFYNGEYHSQPPEDYYKKLQDLNDRGIFL